MNPLMVSWLATGMTDLSALFTTTSLAPSSWHFLAQSGSIFAPHFSSLTHASIVVLSEALPAGFLSPLAAHRVVAIKPTKKIFTKAFFILYLLSFVMPTARFLMWNTD